MKTRTLTMLVDGSLCKHPDAFDDELNNAISAIEEDKEISSRIKDIKFSTVVDKNINDPSLFITIHSALIIYEINVPSL